MKNEGKNRGGEGTTSVITACPEAGKRMFAKKKGKKNGTWCLLGVKGVLSLWCPSALLLFGTFAGQRKRGLRVGG